MNATLYASPELIIFGIIVILAELLNLALHLFTHQKIAAIMDAQERLNGLIADLDKTTNSLADKVEKEVENLKNGQVTDASLDALQKVADHLRTLGADESDPVPATSGTDESNGSANDTNAQA